MRLTIKSTLMCVSFAAALHSAAHFAEIHAHAAGPVTGASRPFRLNIVAQRPAQQDQGEKMGFIENLIDADRLQEARKRLMQETGSRGEDYRTAYLEAKILFKEKRFHDSLNKLESSLALGGHHSEVYKLMASNAIALSRMDVAESNLKIAAQLAPDDHDVHYRLGILYFLSDRFALCESEMQRVVKLRPTLMSAHDILGLALEELGQDKAAINAYRKAIELTRQQGLNDEKPYLHLGKFYSRNGRYQESLPFLQEAIDINPKSAESFFLLGKVQSHLGENQKAQAALQRSVQIDPKYPDPYYLLSRIHLKQGREVDAAREMQLYLEARKHQKLKDEDGRHAVR